MTRLLRPSVRPTNWAQQRSQPCYCANKTQHGKCDHQEKPGPHVVQNGNHRASLPLLDSTTLPTTFTNPRAHRVCFTKDSPATGTLSGPGPSSPLIKPTRFCPCPHPLSAEFPHRISPSLLFLFVVSVDQDSMRDLCSFGRVSGVPVQTRQDGLTDKGQATSTLRGQASEKSNIRPRTSILIKVSFSKCSTHLVSHLFQESWESQSFCLLRLFTVGRH
jgi:hypothetical protein